MKYGAVINPINAEESRSTITELLNRVKPSIVFYDHEMMFDHDPSSASWIPFSDLDNKSPKEAEVFSLASEHDPVFEAPVGDGDEIAEILFTSGTTETPNVITSYSIHYTKLYDNFVIQDITSSIVLTDLVLSSIDVSKSE